MTVETITWTDPDGDETALVDIRGITGRGLPPSDFNDLVVPFQPGSMFRSVRDAARQLVIPILVSGAGSADYRTQLRTLASRLHPTSAPGTLRVATVTGDTRVLVCWCIDGFQWHEEFPDWMTPSVAFRACDPYWYDNNDTRRDFDAGATSKFFPLFPLRLSSSEVFGDITVDNTGDVNAWPVWTITGPGSGLMLRNLTTGKLLSFGRDIDVGEIVTIDTRPGFKSVTLQDGSNLFGSLTGSLWSLAAGLNSVQVEMAGGTFASLVSLRYKRRFLTA